MGAEDQAELETASVDAATGGTDGDFSGAYVFVSWYLNPSSRVMLNWVHSQFDDGTVDDSADALMLRQQFDW